MATITYQTKEQVHELLQVVADSYERTNNYYGKYQKDLYRLDAKIKIEQRKLDRPSDFNDLGDPDYLKKLQDDRQAILDKMASEGYEREKNWIPLNENGSNAPEGLGSIGACDPDGEVQPTAHDKLDAVLEEYEWQGA